MRIGKTEICLNRLADKKNRIRIVAIGIAVWSIATAASGLARNFTHLFIARMSIGVGEATLSPCAMSIISDSFPPEKRGLPGHEFTHHGQRDGPARFCPRENACPQ